MGDKLAQLQELKSFYEQGFMTKEEFDKRQIALIDSMTSTSAEKTNPASPQVQKSIAPVYADRDFMNTQSDSLKHGEYVVVTPPTASNRHLYTGAAPDNPFSYVTPTVPIDVHRGKAPVENAKRMGDTQVIYAHTHAGGADRDQQVFKMEEDKRKLSWELFYAASVNDVPRIKELLDRGADINQRDHDTEATPIIVAAAKGQKHAVYYMVERGADVNAQNHRGETAAHEAVKLKFNEMALWLVKHGADIHLENFRGYSPYDLALPWLQKELKDERDHYLKEQKKKVVAMAQVQIVPPQQQMGLPPDYDGVSAGPGEAPPAYQTMRSPGAPEDLGLSQSRVAKPPPDVKTLRSALQETPHDPNTAAFHQKYGDRALIHKNIVQAEDGKVLIDSMNKKTAPDPVPVPVRGPVVQEVLKIYLKNGSYKAIVVSSDHNAKDLADSMADKLNMSKFANYFDVIEIQRGQEKRLEPNTNILQARKKWPLILGPSGNETEQQCKFAVVPKRGTPENITMMYRDAIYGKSA